MTDVNPHIRRDGRFIVERRGLKDPRVKDLYHLMLSTSWPIFLLLLVGLYLGVNFCFAVLYTVLPGSVSQSSGTLLEHFFFAVETMSTVGYGAMAPQSLYAHWLMVAQSITGFLLTAVSTGLMFAKFSRIQAEVLFSESVLLQVHDGKPVLTFRVANKRTAQIVDAQMNVTLVKDEMTREGISVRRLYDLKLRRHRSPLFALVWNVYHEIDNQSPLWAVTAEDLDTDKVTLIITCSGIDDSLGQTLHTRYAYNWQDFRFDVRFADIIRFEDNGIRYVDYQYFHQTETHSILLPWSKDQ